ncbi:hypothetical protein [Candidatus Roseilinea sp. NK_OTU-006]|jgi:predicted transcriptional regulator|uniref:hypothetical protein n=1 Tax=Candidatus Roseilinea sp. NK_OTU-006 TaxID=2704250 RepID=UPI00145FC6DE|nr:hypothetical protein [Candidatus Roseilinea sp. NK_OTU-006]
MSFTVNDLQDLTRLLATHPEWLGEVRRLVLTEELLKLPEVIRELVVLQRRTEEQLAQLAVRVNELTEAQRRTEERLDQLAARVDQLAEAQRRTEERLDQLAARVDQLAEAQRRTEERLDQLAARVDQLAEAQRRTEERLDQLAARVDQLAEAQRRTEERLDQLAEAQRRTEERLDQLAEAQRRTEERLDQLAEAQRRTEERLDQLAARVDQLTQTTQLLVNQMAEVRGDLLEIKFRERASAYFGRWLRRIRVVPITDIEDQLDTVLTDKEVNDLLALDLLVRGRPRLAEPEAEEVWLAVEVSSVVDANDVQRAARRAALLRRIGLRVVPVAAGARINPAAKTLAESYHVALMQDGAARGWEQAYRAALS